MTIDHHPYLAAGDLRTAEDVLAWLDAHRLDAIEGRALLAPSTSFGPPVRGADADAVSIRTLHVLHRDLAERLDRERRQACRRGALLAFSAAARMMRTYEHDLSLGAVNDWLEAAITCALAEALAFRAAARAR